MDVEKEAREAALKQVAALIQRPDHLERISEMRKRSERKKAAVEAMLRTGVQSQLEGIRSAIAQLKTAAEDVVAIETETELIRKRLAPFPALQNKMSALRECSIRHDQYAAAIENLRIILHMHDLIAEGKAALNESRLLAVHKNIMDLERARDELMYEVHKLGGPTSERDKKSLVMFFKEVDELVDGMWSDMKMIFKRCLDMVRGNEKGDGPQHLVSALRIVEREERIDKYYVDRRVAMNNMMPPGRPRRWREAVMLAIEKNVQQRIEGNQIEHDRSTNAAWLGRYLGLCQEIVVNDLILARSASFTCFPPEYQMYDRFVSMYHNGMRNRLRDLIHEDSLQKAEIVQLLTWIKEYTSDKMFGDPRLKINAVAIVADEPLLPPDVQAELQEKFLAMTKADMTNWLMRTLDSEMGDWYKNVFPEEDGEKRYYTSLPNILFGMLEDTLALARPISMDLVPRVIDLVMQELQPFVVKYREAAVAFKAKHFENRSSYTHFTSITIAAANNMMSSAESTEKYLRQIRLSMEEETGHSSSRGIRKADVIEHANNLVDAWNAGSTSITSVLIEEVMTDLNKHMVDLFSRKWLDGSDPLGVVQVTLSDYHSDHAHLRSNILLYLAQSLHIKIVGEYLKAVESRRLTFAALSERQRAADQLKKDASRIERTFQQYVPVEEQSQFTPLHSILLSIAELLELSDRSIISLTAANFARRFPNCPADVLASLLLLREDIGRVEAKTLAEESLAHTAHHPKDAAFGELFKLSRADGSSWSVPIADVHTATSRLANMLRRGVGDT